MPTDTTPRELKQPWLPAQATRAINALARQEGLDLTWTTHALQQVSARDLIASDVLYLLRNGFVHREAQPSTIPELFKYRVESRTPNSGNRIVGAVVIPSPRDRAFKIITVMWIDE